MGRGERTYNHTLCLGGELVNEPTERFGDAARLDTERNLRFASQAVLDGDGARDTGGKEVKPAEAFLALLP